MTTYYIIYPSGDRTKLSILELSEAMQYELTDYALASRESFLDKDDAVDYAKNLAKKHNKTFVCDGHDYLD